jgi:hypothetical protein
MAFSTIFIAYSSQILPLLYLPDFAASFHPLESVPIPGYVALSNKTKASFLVVLLKSSISSPSPPSP